MNLSDQVKQGLFDLSCSELQQGNDIQARIIQYLLLIEKWNKHYNLTAIRAIEAMVSQHIMDSLSVVAHVYGSRIVDVGTGAGLPGIPLAIVRPDWQITLIEGNQKKATFLQQAKIELNLSNLTILAQRVENMRIQENINTVISRAYASLGTFLKTTHHLVSPQDAQCRWVAMKGRCSDQELKEVEAPFYVEERIPLAVPGLQAQRELVVIRQSAQSTGLD